MAGYSATPLAQKLGMKSGHKVALVDAPDGFVQKLEGLPAGVQFVKGASRRDLDVVVLFVKARAALEKKFPALAKRLAPAGGLWVAWPKKASGVATDLTEDVAREIALSHRLVDNKVCAIDDTWSGLRCVIRLVDRPAARPTRAR
jgi:hypothetical protein